MPRSDGVLGVKIAAPGIGATGMSDIAWEAPVSSAVLPVKVGRPAALGEFCHLGPRNIVLLFGGGNVYGREEVARRQSMFPLLVGHIDEVRRVIGILEVQVAGREIVLVDPS